MNMSRHEPDGYVCPFCLIVQGIENHRVHTKQHDVVCRDESVTAFIASHWYPANPGHVIIIPNRHIENLYDMAEELLCRVHALTKRIAVAVRETYGCAGITVRQNNEQAGNQYVWHYHVHVYPRYEGDGLFKAGNVLSEPEERNKYAGMLRAYLWENGWA